MSQMITIGEISKPHKQNGAVKTLILSDFPERFLELERVFLEKGSEIKRVFVEDVQFHKNFAIIKFKEINTYEDAQKLAGFFLKLPEEEAVELPEGHYYIYQLLGMEVFTDTDEYLGQLVDIITTGSNDIYVVHQGKKEILLPATHEVVKVIDLNQGRMIVHLLDGLVER